MPRIPKLADVAARQAEDEKKKKARGVLGALASLLGLSGEKAAKPDAKMSKRTETTKHTIVEEDDSDDADAEDEDSEADAEDDESDADAEAMDSATDKPDPEEEDESGGEDAEEGDEEEKAISRAVAAAYKSPAVHAAFIAAIPEKFRASAELRAPKRLYREIRKSTGAKTFDGAMTALSRSRTKAAEASATLIAKLAETEARVAKVEKRSRVERVDAMVAEAKASGKAPTKALRATLREHGNAHGTKALAKLIASLPVVAPTKARLPGNEGADGAPSGEEQARMMEVAMSDLDPERREQFLAITEEKKAKERLNGAGRLS